MKTINLNGVSVAVLPDFDINVIMDKVGTDRESYVWSTVDNVFMSASQFNTKNAAIENAKLAGFAYQEPSD